MKINVFLPANCWRIFLEGRSDVNLVSDYDVLVSMTDLQSLKSIVDRYAHINVLMVVHANVTRFRRFISKWTGRTVTNFRAGWTLYYGDEIVHLDAGEWFVFGPCVLRSGQEPFETFCSIVNRNSFICFNFLGCLHNNESTTFILFSFLNVYLKDQAIAWYKITSMFIDL